MPSANEPGGPDHAGVVAPPPLIFLACLILSWGLGQVLGAPRTGLIGDLRILVSIALGAPAAFFLIGALWGFRKAGTAARPWKGSTAIVDTGVYGLTRNPMYLAMAMLYAAAAVLADSLFALAGLIPALAVIHYGVILREERYLEAKFGDEYRRYKAAVRRWI